MKNNIHIFVGCKDKSQSNGLKFHVLHDPVVKYLSHYGYQTVPPRGPHSSTSPINSFKTSRTHHFYHIPQNTQQSEKKKTTLIATKYSKNSNYRELIWRVGADTSITDSVTGCSRWCSGTRLRNRILKNLKINK